MNLFDTYVQPNVAARLSFDSMHRSPRSKESSFLVVGPGRVCMLSGPQWPMGRTGNRSEATRLDIIIVPDQPGVAGNMHNIWLPRLCGTHEIPALGVVWDMELLY